MKRTNGVWSSPKYSDKSYYTYSHGSKDDWYLLYHDDRGEKKLFDKDYFNEIKALSEKYDKKKVYKDFEKVYDMVTKNARTHESKPEPSQRELEEIQTISMKYNKDSLKVEKLFGLLYLTMIAEWYYRTPSGHPSILKHSVKKLGIYQVIFEKKDGAYAASFSKGTGAQELKNIMRNKGLII